MKMIDREKKELVVKEYASNVKFLYNTSFGRLLLKILATRTIANLVGSFMNSKLSLIMKKYILHKHDFDMCQFEENHYLTYNSFFTRKYKDEYINIDKNKNVFISPCESKLTIFKIDENEYFEIKGSKYKLHDILNEKIIDDYKDGYLLLFRLETTDYHRYCFIDDGERSEYKFIPGKLHTVQPIVYDKYKVFHQNCREWTMLNTKNFDNIIQMEVGAMLIGRISNDKEKLTFNKGDEKGYFEFGGSTILLFVKDNIIDFDEDIIDNSNKGIETIVRYGEKIGVKHE